MSTKTLTANGATTFKSSGDALVNLFFQIGASRNNVGVAKKLFDTAMADDIQKATAILCYARDARNGMGERNIFRVLIKELIVSDVNLARKVLNIVPELGRFDDLESFFGTSLEDDAVNVWVTALKADNALAAKWCDRTNKPIQRALGMNEARLRKFLSKIRKDTIVETAMCDNKWDSIAYNKIPSLAGVRYSKCFNKHDELRYTTFMADKNTKVNGSVNYPYNVYQLYKSGNADDAASKYWKNLKQLNISGNILCIVDVSGSMACPASGKVSCMDVSISLGTFLSQQIKGHFHNKLITFSDDPCIVSIPDSENIGEVFGFVERIDWGGSTNLNATFTKLLAEAIKFKVKPKDMPSMLLILSDMQFNSTSNYATLYENMKEKYALAGYTAPSVTWWNLNSAGNNFPVMKDEKGCCLVSGFSPRVLEAIVGAEEFTPISVMEDAIKPYVKMLEK